MTFHALHLQRPSVKDKIILSWTQNSEVLSPQVFIGTDHFQLCDMPRKKVVFLAKKRCFLFLIRFHWADRMNINKNIGEKKNKSNNQMLMHVM